MMDRQAAARPGEILPEDVVDDLSITPGTLAVAIGVPPRRINEIGHGRRRITAATALRPGRYFPVEDEFRLDPQNRYELEVERDAPGDAPDTVRPLRSA